MILAAFYRGPYDGERLVLPTDTPWPRFVIPKFGPVTIEHFYLLADQLDDNLWAYLFDETFSSVTDDV